MINQNINIPYKDYNVKLEFNIPYVNMYKVMPMFLLYILILNNLIYKKVKLKEIYNLNLNLTTMNLWQSEIKIWI